MLLAPARGELLLRCFFTQRESPASAQTDLDYALCTRCRSLHAGPAEVRKPACVPHRALIASAAHASPSRRFRHCDILAASELRRLLREASNRHGTIPRLDVGRALAASPERAIPRVVVPTDHDGTLSPMAAHARRALFAFDQPPIPPSRARKTSNTRPRIAQRSSIGSALSNSPATHRWSEGAHLTPLPWPEASRDTSPSTAQP